jgi:hypothetical protein
VNNRTPRPRSSAGDALGDSLLGDRQVGSSFLELARFRNGDEGAYCFEIHADPPW